MAQLTVYATDVDAPPTTVSAFTQRNTTYTPFTRRSWLDELARRAHDKLSSCARRALVERTSCARRAGLMSWLSGHLNSVILQTFTKLHDVRSSSWLDERTSCTRRASSSSQLHRVNGVLYTTIMQCECRPLYT